MLRSKIKMLLPECFSVNLFRILILSFLVFNVFGFNVDVENGVRHRGPTGSMFGFTVAEHKERGNSWVLVGAPEAQTTQPGVTRGGAVFRCDISRDDACTEVPFDTKGNNIDGSGSQLDLKSYQWFGATLQSSGEDGVVVACAPRYVWFTKNKKMRDPVGTCYVSRNQFNNFSEYSPCRVHDRWGYHRQGSCQAGMSASLSKNSQRLFLGAPGSCYWQGQTFALNLYDRDEIKASTNDGSGPTDDDSYLGYSVTSGTFSGESGVAVGMPRGAVLLGKVVIFTTNLENIQNITGEQLGAYFGYSIATSDVDGDGTDDLIIGAPLYTDGSKDNNAGHYETGRIYIVYQGKETYKFRKLHTRDGKNSKARFGLSLTNLGDINKDGYGDFAVGAPYDGLNERGVVYIYHGSPIGAREKPSQIITAEEFTFGGTQSSLTTFGFSLSGGMDLDGNQYPDLVIGAYEANTAFFLRSRPVIKVQSTLTFSSESKQIVLEETNCTLKDYTKVACLTLTACLEYSGIGVDPVTEMNVQVLLDSKKPKSPRMYFLSDEGKNVINQTLKLTKEKQFCKSMFIYVKPNIKDKLTSLESELRYSLQKKSSSTRRLNRELTPILDLDDENGLVSRDSISIQKNCGKDNVCIPDLKLTSVPSVNRYILGSGDKMEVDVLVENDGEDSFETTFDMGIPNGMNYVNIERYDEGSSKNIPILCSAPSYLNNNTLHCDIGNPLPSKKLVHFKVLLQPSYQETLTPRYEFSMSVNSTNPEITATSNDNLKNINVPVWVETDLIVEGSSHPVDLYYNSSLFEAETIKEEGEAGPQLVHIYNIRNKGPSDIMEAEAYFLWPSYTIDGDHLLYLLEQPETSGAIRCEAIPNTNELNLQLDKKKSYLETTGVIGTQHAYTSSASSSSSNADGSTVYIEEKAYQQSSSSSSSSASNQRGSAAAAGGGRNKIGGNFATNSGSGSKIYSGKEYSSGATQGQKFSGNSFAGASGGSRQSSSSSSGGGDKIAYEISVADLAAAAASKQESASSKESNEELRSNVIHEENIKYGNIPQVEGTYHKSSSASGSASSGTNYGASSATNYGASSGSNYGSTSKTGGGYMAETSSSGSVVNRNRYGNSGGGSSFSSEANAAWAITGEKPTGINLDVNIAGLKNSSTYHSSEKTHSINSTWDPIYGGRTYESDSWNTNDNGRRRNGSTSNVYGEQNGQGGRHYVSVGKDEDIVGGGGDGAGGNYGESRKALETESEYRYRIENERRYSSSRSGGSSYGDGDWSRTVNNDDYDPEEAKREQDRRYQEELRRYNEEIRKLKEEDEIRRKKEERLRNEERERYLAEQRRLRQYDNLSSESPDRSRYKRDVDSSDEALENALKCGPTKCTIVKCQVGPLQKDQEAWVAFRSRVWIPTIRKIAANKEVSLSSLLVARVTKIPHIGKPDQATIKKHEIFTKVIPRETGVPSGMVPLWVVVLSACAGALILMLLVYLLYKWGFFKRNRPTDAAEKEPLNRNGYQHAED